MKNIEFPEIEMKMKKLAKIIKENPKVKVCRYGQVYPKNDQVYGLIVIVKTGRVAKDKINEAIKNAEKDAIISIKGAFKKIRFPPQGSINVYIATTIKAPKNWYNCKDFNNVDDNYIPDIYL